MTILVVDDEPDHIDKVSRVVVRLGYEMTIACSGQLALESVARQQPDIVLIDVTIPILDGFEVCRRLKSDSATRLIPVILVMDQPETEDRVRGFEAGADDLLAKPVNVPELEARLRSLAHVKRYTDGLDSTESMILGLALTIETRDPYTRGHCERLADSAAALGTHLGLPMKRTVGAAPGRLPA